MNKVLPTKVAEVIKIDGVCYQFSHYDSVPVTDISAEPYDTCEDCQAISLAPSAQEISSAMEGGGSSNVQDAGSSGDVLVSCGSCTEALTQAVELYAEDTTGFLFFIPEMNGTFNLEYRGLNNDGYCIWSAFVANDGFQDYYWALRWIGAGQWNLVSSDTIMANDSDNVWGFANATSCAFGDPCGGWPYQLEAMEGAITTLTPWYCNGPGSSSQEAVSSTVPEAGSSVIVESSSNPYDVDPLLYYCIRHEDYLTSDLSCGGAFNNTFTDCWSGQQFIDSDAKGKFDKCYKTLGGAGPDGKSFLLAGPFTTLGECNSNPCPPPPEPSSAVPPESISSAAPEATSSATVPVVGSSAEAGTESSTAPWTAFCCEYLGTPTSPPIPCENPPCDLPQYLYVTIESTSGPLSAWRGYTFELGHQGFDCYWQSTACDGLGLEIYKNVGTGEWDLFIYAGVDFYIIAYDGTLCDPEGTYDCTPPRVAGFCDGTMRASVSLTANLSCEISSAAPESISSAVPPEVVSSTAPPQSISSTAPGEISSAIIESVSSTTPDSTSSTAQEITSSTLPVGESSDAGGGSTAPEGSTVPEASSLYVPGESSTELPSAIIAECPSGTCVGLFIDVYSDANCTAFVERVTAVDCCDVYAGKDTNTCYPTSELGYEVAASHPGQFGKIAFDLVTGNLKVQNPGDIGYYRCPARCSESSAMEMVSSETSLTQIASSSEVPTIASCNSGECVFTEVAIYDDANCTSFVAFDTTVDCCEVFNGKNNLTCYPAEELGYEIAAGYPGKFGRIIFDLYGGNLVPLVPGAGAYPRCPARCSESSSAQELSSAEGLSPQQDSASETSSTCWQVTTCPGDPNHPGSEIVAFDFSAEYANGQIVKFYNSNLLADVCYEVFGPDQCEFATVVVQDLFVFDDCPSCLGSSSSQEMSSAAPEAASSAAPEAASSAQEISSLDQGAVSSAEPVITATCNTCIPPLLNQYKVTLAFDPEQGYVPGYDGEYIVTWTGASGPGGGDVGCNWTTPNGPGGFPLYMEYWTDFGAWYVYGNFGENFWTDWFAGNQCNPMAAYTPDIPVASTCVVSVP